MKKHAAPFVLKLESISRSGCQMLDLDVSTVRGCGGYRSCVFRLFVKPTNIWRPLSPESQHPASIHKHWPAAQAKRIFSRFSNAGEGMAAVNNFKAFYKRSFGAAICDEYLPKRPKQVTAWLVLPYSLCLVLGGLPKIVRSFCVPSSFCFDKVGLSWSLGGKHLIHLLRGRNNLSSKQAVS